MSCYKKSQQFQKCHRSNKTPSFLQRCAVVPAGASGISIGVSCAGRRKKRAVAEESSKIIKENWRKTDNEEWGNNCIRGGKLLIWETKTHSSVLNIDISRYFETPRKANASAKTKPLPGAKQHDIRIAWKTIKRAERRRPPADLSVVLSIIRPCGNHGHCPDVHHLDDDCASDCLITWRGIWKNQYI